MLKLLPILLFGFLVQEKVQAQCDSSFTVNIYGATIQLKAGDSSTHKIHRWYFGDGVQGWGTPVYHTYSSPGTYVVKHIIIDSLTNCRDSAQKTINISFPVSCSASFVTTRDSNYNYHFYSNSTVSGGSIQSYKWKVDDSTVSTASSFSRLLLPGVHFVCLTIQTTAGCISTVCDSVRVDSIRNCNVSASFTATPAASNPAQISFIPSPSGPTWSYTWRFGDGQGSTIKFPTHVYTNPGTYTVTLIVKDSATRCSDSSKRTIYIPAAPQDSCTVSFTYTANPSQPSQLTFSAISNDSIVSQTWIIRPCDSLSHDTAVYTIPNPVHNFTTPGCYRVCLRLLTKTGCYKKYCNTVIIPNDSTGRRSSAERISSFPNPAYGTTVTIQLGLVQPEKVKLAVFNSFGNIVYTNEKQFAAGQNNIAIPLDKLQRGLYFVEIKYGNVRKQNVFQKL